jgi:hypothetical protein
VSNEIIPANSTPQGVDRQRGYKTDRTRALWRLAQGAAKQPGEALVSTAVVCDGRRDAVVMASRIRLGRVSTINNALADVNATGRLEAWAEEHHFGHTIGVRFLPKHPPSRLNAPYEVPTRPTSQARETANQ